ncbi:HIT domain-containing protein [Dokdonella soli]|uniref:HIT family protein n=1 Tax=Dokdonella soli TaxID=529810 RepID=A0ABN1IBC8_9GAMM
MTFLLDPRLAAETHMIGELPLSRLLLMEDARFPWLILVPRIAGARELIDLDEADRRSLLTELAEVGRALETLLRPDKLNIAALGNVVAQLHVHLIARYTADAAWPRPVWGHGERVDYSANERDTLIARLRVALKSVLT